MNTYLNNKIISLLIFFIFFFFSLFSPLLTSNQVQAEVMITENNNSNYSWLKSIAFFGSALLLNYFFDDSNQEEAARISESPLIDEKDSSTADKEVLGFYVNWVTNHANSYQSLLQNRDNIDMTAPFWYTLNPNGNIQSRYGGHQYEVMSLARENDIKVLPLINNNQQNNDILVKPETRTKAVNNVIDLLNRYDYDGVNIDFENIPPWTREGYIKFIKLLSKKMQIYDKLLTVSVFPKINVPLELHGAHDYKAIAPYVDRLVMMTYDHNWAQGSPGPIAPLSWVEENILYALEYIPSEKLILGIANYGYDWIDNGNGEDLSANRAYDIAQQKNIEIKRDSYSSSPHFKYEDNEGNLREVWFEDSYSLEPKLKLVDKYNLKGIGIWRLGNASDRFWEVIQSELR